MTVTFEQIVASARKVVAAAPEGFQYVIPGSGAQCMYVPASDPRAPQFNPDRTIAPGAQTTGCLVGEILNDLGLLTDEIASSREYIESLIADLRVPQISYGSRSCEFLTRIQIEQDLGQTWARSFELALEYAA